VFGGRERPVGFGLLRQGFVAQSDPALQERQPPAGICLRRDTRPTRRPGQETSFCPTVCRRNRRGLEACATGLDAASGGCESGAVQRAARPGQEARSCPTVCRRNGRRLETCATGLDAASGGCESGAKAPQSKGQEALRQAQGERRSRPARLTLCGCAAALSHIPARYAGEADAMRLRRSSLAYPCAICWRG